MSASLVVSDKNKHISGEIIIEKDKDKNIIVNRSNISNIISGNTPCELNFNSLNEIVEQIKIILYGMCFSSRYCGMDMYTNKYYDVDDDKFCNKYLYGIQQIYNIPGGIVMFHKSNDLLFQCTNIEFMITENIIPFQYTNIDNNKIYLVKRTSGDIQNACILNNGGLFLKDETFMISNNFSSSKDEILYPKAINNFQKAVVLEDFLILNDIKLEIKMPYFDSQIINSSSNIMSEVLNYYNNKLKLFSEGLNMIEKYII